MIDTQGAASRDNRSGQSAAVTDCPTYRAQLARKLVAHCANYRGAITWRGIYQLATTGAAFFAAIAIAMWSVDYSYWLTLAIIVIAAGLLVRLFIIQHDCGHGSFFHSRRANDLVGRITSLLTLTPYGFWRMSHATHHASSGNLDKRGIGDVDTLTVREYLNRSRWRRLSYRLYRNPLILLLVGAPVHFLLLQRLPNGVSHPSREAWISVLSLNAAIILFYGLVIFAIGAKLFFLVLLPVSLIAAWVGGWMFFIQHQFEATHWSQGSDWDFHIAAIFGSSYYVLPRVLQWFTGNIGLHHIHHLCSKIPNYRLQECLDASPELQQLNRLTIWQSLRCVQLALWDEAQNKLISFRQLKRLQMA